MSLETTCSKSGSGQTLPWLNFRAWSYLSDFCWLLSSWEQEPSQDFFPANPDSGRWPEYRATGRDFISTYIVAIKPTQSVNTL